IYCICKMPKRKIPKFQELDASIEIFFPPEKPQIKIEELIQNALKKSNLPAKIPNAFMIYRQEILKELNAQNLTVGMPRLSVIASKTWKIANQEIKNEYYRLAKRANTEYKNFLFQQTSFANKHLYVEPINNEQISFSNQHFYNVSVPTNNMENQQILFSNEHCYTKPINNVKNLQTSFFDERLYTKPIINKADQQFLLSNDIIIPAPTTNTKICSLMNNLISRH
ncbi:6658_t:CDS:1, partial [Ambispora leptoticha]